MNTAVFGDLDGDGDLDLIVSLCFQDNHNETAGVECFTQIRTLTLTSNPQRIRVRRPDCVQAAHSTS